MKVTQHSKTEGNKYEMSVNIDAAEFKAATEQAYEKAKDKIDIQGFRKGKAPKAVVEKMYGDTVFYDDAIDIVLPEAFDLAINESEISFIGRPDIKVVSVDIDNGANLMFTVELRPELTVKKYKGIEVTQPEVEVSEQDIEAEINSFRDKASRIVPVEARAAQDADIANIDFEGFVDGVAFDGGKGEKFDLTLGSGQFIPGFEEQVVGKNIGEEFDVEVKFPEEYGAQELAGKDATFKCKLNELKVKEFPEVDDEFAKDVSEFNSLEELKQDITKRLTESKEEFAKQRVEDEIAKAVSEQLEGEVPEAMINDRAEELMREFAYRLQSQGLNLETYMKYMGQEKEEFRKTFDDQALSQVKVRLALEAVVRAENIVISDQDVQKEYETLAEKYNMEIDNIKKAVMEKELKGDLAATKALDFIRDNAKITIEKKK